jgi:hypothetical protein
MIEGREDDNRADCSILTRWSDIVQLGLCAGVTALWVDVWAHQFWWHLTARFGLYQYAAAAFLAPALGLGGLALLAACTSPKTKRGPVSPCYPTFVIASVIGIVLYTAFHVTWGRLGMPRLADVLGMAYLPLLLWHRPARASSMARPLR